MYKLIFISVIFAAAIVCVCMQPEENGDTRKLPNDTFADREKLTNDLFYDYNKENYPDNITVELGFILVNADLVWTDNRLRWNEADYGISVLRVPSSKVWLPDIFVYNGPMPSMECSSTNALLYPNGEVLIMPPCKIQTYCDLTPGNEQECMIKYLSWTFDGWIMDLTFYKNNTKADLSDYLGGGKYEVTKNEGIRHVYTYECCKEPYVELQFHFGFKKVVKGEKICKTKQ